MSRFTLQYQSAYGVRDARVSTVPITRSAAGVRAAYVAHTIDRATMSSGPQANICIERHAETIYVRDRKYALVSAR
jgi:hypothetical protein